MDQNRIQRTAQGARASLMAGVRAALARVTAPGSPERLAEPAAVAGVERLAAAGTDALVERVAYTWFNRLCALRYMDARGYTPAGVVTPRAGETLPAVLTDARGGVFAPGLALSPERRARVEGLLSGAAPAAAPLEEAYVLLLLAACEGYEGAMGYLFGAEGPEERAAFRLLAPAGLLAPDGIRARIVEGMDQASCAEGVEVLGWLYQFYVAERKDEFFQSGRKAGPSDIAPATQLFTPGWIVRYLVQNSLGRLWMQNRPESALAARMEYYLPPEPGVPYLHIEGPEEIRFLDPACGSGHILVYAFELLFYMYEEEGWPAREIPALILQNNLFGLEIDPRAAELAGFCLEMCARERDPGFFGRRVDAQVRALRPVAFGPGELDRAGVVAASGATAEALAHLDQVGSLWEPEPGAVELLRAAEGAVHGAEGLFGVDTAAKLERAREQAELLSERYQVVCANPPYMGSGKFNPWLSGWVRANYPDERGDLCCCFVRRGLNFTQDGGYVAMVTASSWMFIGSFEKMRKGLLSEARICSMIQQSTHGFPGVTVPTCMFALQKGAPAGEGTYIRLEDFDRPQWQQPRAFEAVSDPACPWRHRADQRSFAAIPGSPIAYWAGEGMLRAFREGTPLKDLAHPSAGITTGDNARFIRLWWEIGLESIDFDESTVTDEAGSTTWYPCNKGGQFRKWYGNRENIMRFDAASRREMESCPGYRPVNLERQFKGCISWSDVTSGSNSFRQNGQGVLFDQVSKSAFPPKDQMDCCNAFLNSSTCEAMLKLLSPTLHCNAGEIGKLPYLAPALTDTARVTALVRENIRICREDWDSFETSWDFQRHPLCLPGEPLVERQFARWETECTERFDRLKANEEELNAIFARVYGMEGEVPIEVAPDKVSVRRADVARDVKSLISYGVGCVFGRYSIDAPGLVLADAGSTLDDFRARVPGARFLPDESGILPMTAVEGADFADDAAAALTRWLAAAYGEEALGQNLRFIEGALGKGLRAYLLEDFYRDHLARYQVHGSGKRPVYWLVQSPKKGFQALIYLHRYTPGTMGRVLTDYVRPFRRKVEGLARTAEAEATARGRARAARLRAVAEELDAWEREALYPLAQERVALDLDDGVRANYQKLAGVLARVPGLS